MTSISTELFHMLNWKAGMYDKIMHFWEPLLFIVGILGLVGAILWAINIWKLYSRKQFLDERLNLIYGIIEQRGWCICTGEQEENCDKKHRMDCWKRLTERINHHA